MKKNYFFLMLLVACKFTFAQFSQDWQKTFNGNGYREYYNVQTVRDGSNTFVAAGFYLYDSIQATTSQPIKRNAGFVVIKYNSGVNSQSYVKTFESAYCDFNSISINTSGDVFIAATVAVTGQGTNAQLFKYNSSGVLQSGFPINYNSGSSFNDVAFGIANDASGNFFLASNDSIGTATQAVTIRKYNSAAVLQWSKSYNNAGTTEKGLKLMLVGADPVFIAEKFNLPTKDFILIGYSTTAGLFNFLTTLPQDVAYSDVQFCHLAKDFFSNIWVGIKGQKTGTTFDGVGYKFSVGGLALSSTIFAGTGSTLDDKLRLAFNQTGGDAIIVMNEQNQASLKVQRFDGSNTPQWATEFVQANMVLGDASTEPTPVSTYIVGTLNDGTTELKDARLIKLNSAGGVVYSVGYDNSNYSSNEMPSSIAIISSGTVAYTGLMTETNGTTKIYSQGYNAIGAGTGTQIYLDFNEDARNIVTDASGNVYVSGTTKDGVNPTDIFINKYTNTGTLVWKTKVGASTTDETTAARQLAVDVNGNVFVAGTSTLNDILIACLRASDGAMYGQAIFNGTGNSIDKAIAITTDAASNVYITGETRSSGSNINMAVLKYNKFCIQQFATSYDGTALGTDVGRDIKLSSGGDIYILGESVTSASGTADITLVKYTNSGTFLFASSINDANGTDEAGGLTLDASNNIYITGSVVNVAFNTDAITAKYNTSGVQQWQNIFNNGTKSEVGADVSINGNGEVGVGGQSVTAGASDILVVKLNPDGTSNYAATYNGAGSGNDFERNVYINSSGNIFVGGYFRNTGSVDAGVLLHYNNAGSLVNTISIASGTSNTVSRSYFDGLGKAFLAGTANIANPNDAFITQFTMPITNEAPQVSNFINQSTCGAAVGPISFTVLDETIATVTVSASSNNTTVIPNANITIGGSLNNRTITVTPAVSQFGLVTISVSAVDAALNTTTKTFTVDVVAPPATPTISADGSLSICPAGSVNLTSSSAIGNTWSTGATTQSINVATTQTITVSVTGACGSATSSPITVTMGSAPSTPTITPDGSLAICPSGSVNLTSSAATGNTWSTGATTQSINVATANTITVSVSNACGSATSAPISVTMGSAPSTPTITPDGATSFCPGGSVNLTSSAATSNTWSTGATTQSINVATANTITVSVSNACGSATSAPISVTILPCGGYNAQGIFATAQCGFLNQTPGGTMKATIISGAVKYRFDFYAVASNIIIATRTQTSATINLGSITMPATGTLPNSPFSWGTQYDVTVTPIATGNDDGVASTKCRLGFMAQPTPSNIGATSLKSPTCQVNQILAPTVLSNATITCTTVSQANAYQFKLVNTSNISNTIIVNATYVNQLNLGTLSGLQAGATYAVSARATVYGVQAANFGNVCYLKINGDEKLAIENVGSQLSLANSKFDVSLFPNPFNNELTFNISSSKNELVTIVITDVLGKLVYTEKTISNSQLQITNLKLESGVYFVNITTTNGEKKVMRVVKQ